MCACSSRGGLHDQNPNDWDDKQCRTAADLNIPEVVFLSSDDSDIDREVERGEDGCQSGPAHDPKAASTACTGTGTGTISSRDSDNESQDSEGNAYQGMNTGEESQEMNSMTEGPRGDSCQQSKKKRAGPANRGSGRGKGRRRKRQRS